MFRWIMVMAALALLTACSTDEAPPAHDASVSSAQPVVAEVTAPAAEDVAEPAVSPATVNAPAPSSDCSIAELAEPVEPVVSSAPAETTTAILTLELPCSFGPVLLNHRGHAEMMSCATCHPTDPPSKIAKSKKEFHALCRGCHADQNAGPTKCNGCHNRE